MGTTVDMIKPPPWPDPLFTHQDINDLLIAGKESPPFAPANIARFGEALNEGFRSAWRFQIEVATVREPDRKFVKVALRKVQKHAESLGELLEPAEPLRIREAISGTRPALVSDVGGVEGIDAGTPANQLAISERLDTLGQHVDAALLPRIADAVLAEYAERNDLNLSMLNEEGAHALRQRAVSDFLLSVTPAVLDSLACRAEVARRLREAAGSATAGQRRNLFAKQVYRAIAETYIAMFGRGKLATSSQQRKLSSHPMNLFLAKLQIILNDKLSNIPDDQYGAVKLLRGVIKLEKSSFAQEIYKASQDLPS